MMRFKKLLILKIILLALSAASPFIEHAHPFSFYNDALRLNIGQNDDTFIRIKASYIGQVLNKEEMDYLLEAGNITLLLVAVGLKPAYWSWNWKGKKDEELLKIQHIAEKLNLRFIRYTPQHELCFVYDAKMLAGTFLQHKDWLLSREAYVGGGRYSVDDFLRIFRQIDLNALANDVSLTAANGSALQKLDEYLKMAGWSTTQRGHNYNEPGIVGLAMGYQLKDVLDYLALRKTGKPLRDQISWVRRLEGEIMIASHDISAANELADKWMKGRDAAAEILGYVDLVKLRETSVIFLEDQIKNNISRFKKATAMLNSGNKVVVVVKDITAHARKLCRKACADPNRLIFVTSEDLGLAADVINRGMRPVKGITGLQCFLQTECILAGRGDGNEGSLIEKIRKNDSKDASL